MRNTAKLITAKLTKTLFVSTLLAVTFSVNAASLSGTNLAPRTLIDVNQIDTGTSYTNVSQLTNNGTLTNDQFGFFYNDRGSFYNNHVFNNAAASLFENRASVENKGNISNNGLIKNLNSGVISNNSGGQLTNSGTFNNSGRLSITDAGSALSNTGTLNNNDGAMISVVEASLNNVSTITNDGSIVNGSIFKPKGNIFSKNLINTGTVTNFGLFDISKAFGHIPAGTVNNSGTFKTVVELSNHGTFYNSGTFFAQKISFPELKNEVNGQGTFIQTAGLATIDSAMTQESINIKGGVLNGSGIINSQVTVNGTSASNLASLAPGNSIGTLTINGDYTQGEFGLLDIEFDELSSDLLKVSGIANLGGILDFSFIGTDISIGTFNFLTFASLVGSFDSILLPKFEGFDFDVIFGDTYANLVITSAVSEVPVPAALFLFGPALIGFMSLRRKALKR